ncbi:hypothetical protein DRO91_05870 [Candidatus Heimdallarchaeota archaeon]|nr:MAG: hypothetical protein DRO91_05870 [Candidatus Heimdallarchaeota archaeon]
MAQPTSAWTFADYYNAVGERVFNDPAPTGSVLDTCKRFVNEGYQIFLQSHNWGFMYPTASLTIAIDDTDTDLPDDFGAMYGKVSRSADDMYDGLEEVTPDEIRRRRALNDVSGIPSLYALSPKEFVPATGQQWEMLIFPKSSAEITLAFQYRRCAALLSGSTDYPLGGALHAMTILQAAYMVWEQEKDATMSIQSQKFEQYLQNSIRIDNDLRPNLLTRPKEIYHSPVSFDIPAMP